MRDPNRIDDICARLAAAWKRQPDMRLGQLVIASKRGSSTPAFYLEDEHLIEAIEELLNPEDVR